MNKNMALLIVGVFLLGMVLVIFNQYNTPPPIPSTPSAGEIVMSLPAEHLPETDTAVVQDTDVVSREEVPVTQGEKPSAPLDTASSSDVLSVPSSIAQAPTAPVVPVEKPTPEAVPSSPSPIAQEVAPRIINVPSPIAENISASENISTSENTEIPEKKTEKPVEQVVQAEQAQSTEEKVIKKISVLTIGSGVTVRIDSSELPRYKALQLKSPERIVVDFDGQWQLKAPGVPKNAFVTNIRIAKRKDYTRIVIDLSEAPASIRYLKYGKTGLDVRIR